MDGTHRIIATNELGSITEMRYMNKSEKDYYNITTELILVASDAAMNWGLFSKFYYLPFASNYQKFHNFLQATKCASYSALIVELNKLIDKTGFSIFKARDFLQKNPCLYGQTKETTENLIKEINEKLNPHDNLINNLRKRRNRYHIHIDKNDIKDSVYKVLNEYPVEISELELLLKSLCECLGIFLKVYRKSADKAFFNSLEESYIFNFLIDGEHLSGILSLDGILHVLKD